MGFPPLKTKSGEPPAGAGAGAGHVSAGARLVGLNVPVVSSVAGMAVPAASSRVRVTPETSSPPPTSDMIMAFCPPGPTSRMSMSPGKVWLKLFSLTVTLVTVPPKATAMFEG